MRKPLMVSGTWQLFDKKDVPEDSLTIIGGHDLISLMWHHCEALVFEYTDEYTDDEEGGRESEVRYLDPEDSLMGKCWYCMDEAPDNLRTVWTIHNMDIIHQIPNPKESQWAPEYVKAREEDISRLKSGKRTSRG